MKIGFFDSGLGGIFILRAVRKLMPEYDYVFYGDTANLPYGNKREEEIYHLTKKGIEFLYQHNCALAVIACNTASAETLTKLQSEWRIQTYQDRTLLGVIEPVVQTVVTDWVGKTVLLLATKRTVDSGEYDREFTKHKSTHRLSARAMPKLVPLIESGQIDAALQEAIQVVGENRETELLILGCTHYCVLKEGLRKAFPHLPVVSPDEIIPTKLASYLERQHELENRLTKQGTLTLHFTAAAEHYRKLAGEKG